MPNAIENRFLREEICAIHFRVMCELVKDVAWKWWLLPKANKFHFVRRPENEIYGCESIANEIGNATT